jgi:amino acid transporter
MTTPVEIVAASIVISFWDPDSSHLGIYVAVMLVAIVLINVAGAKYFGEAEYVFAALKIVTIIGLVILGLYVRSSFNACLFAHRLRV